MQVLAQSRAARRRLGQAGFSLVEVSIVTAIVLLIAVIGIPAIGGYVMENKVPRVGQELARFVMHARVNAGTSGDVPYEHIATANLAAMVADSTILTLASDGAVLHGAGERRYGRGRTDGRRRGVPVAPEAGEPCGLPLDCVRAAARGRPHHGGSRWRRRSHGQGRIHDLQRAGGGVGMRQRGRQPVRVSCWLSVPPGARAGRSGDPCCWNSWSPPS